MYPCLFYKEQLDATKFYNDLRPYLNGWHETGMIYEGVSDEPIKVTVNIWEKCVK